MDCIFCLIRDNRAPAEFVYNEVGVFGIVPLNPVTPGHVMIIPDEHVSDFSSYWDVAAKTMEHASKYVQITGIPHVNLITSKGAEATQTIFHMHLHIVPRRRNDGLKLPWSN